ADSGKLTRFLALDDLQEELEARLAGRFPTRTRRRRVRTLSDVWRFVRRLLVVIPLTLVIWFLAYQESLIPAKDIELELNITRDSALHVDVLRPRPPVFKLALRGPTREIEALRARAAERPIKLDWPLPAAYARPGQPRLEKEELLTVIANLPALHNAGVFVEDVAPDSFEFVVNEVASVTVPVEANAGALRVAVERIEPERVKVWLRRGDLDRLSEDQRFIEANLEERLIGAARNRPLEFAAVPLELRVSEFEVLRVEPAEVDIRLRVEGETGSRQLKGVRVQLAVSPQVWQRYDIDYADANEWLLELEVAGDETVVDTLRPQDVDALVVLTSDQAVPSTEYRSMEVLVELPEGVTLVGPSRLVQFRLIPREGSTP
ncbi:MAG: hypothetical protein ACE5I3_14875, partial [Phycisphaerae bacterium]